MNDFIRDNFLAVGVFLFLFLMIGIRLRWECIRNGMFSYEQKVLTVGLALGISLVVASFFVR